MLLFAFSFLQELQRNPHLIIDGVSRFDVMQGEIGKVIFLFWKRLAQSNNLWLFCYVLSARWEDHGSCSKQLLQINPDSHKSTHNLSQIFSRIPKCSSNNPCYLFMTPALYVYKDKVQLRSGRCFKYKGHSPGISRHSSNMCLHPYRFRRFFLAHNHACLWEQLCSHIIES